MKIFSRGMMGFLASFLILFTGFHSMETQASNEKEHKTIRVGYVDSPNFSEGNSDDDAKTGYAYEYLQRLSAYAGWGYEYVYGEWIDILTMLENGEVDVMAGITYTEDRAQHMSFPKYSMGHENYYIYAYEDQPFVSGGIDRIAGAKIGCTRNSMQNYYLNLWNEQMGGICEIVTFDGNDDLYEAFDSYEIDAVVDTDNAILVGDNMIPIVRVGDSEYYLAVSKSQPQLLEEINRILENISLEDPYWVERLHHRYFAETTVRTGFSDADRQWLSEHPVIRIGYEKKFLAFCGYNEKTGELEGALKTFIDLIEDKYRDEGIHFEAIPYDSVGAAMEALRKGEVDVAFPIYQSLTEAEKEQVLITNGLASTAMTAILQKKGFSEFDDNTVAVVEGFTDIEWYIQGNYPNWKITNYPSFEECLEAVRDGKADCVVESTYVYKYFLEDDSFSTISLSKSAEVSFIMMRENNELYSIINHMITNVPETSIIASMAQYSNPKRTQTFADFIKNNIVKVLVISIIIFLLLTILLFRTMTSELKVRNAQKQTEKLLDDLHKKQTELEEALHRAYYDGLTGLYNRYYCNEIEHDLDKNEEYDLMSVVILDVNGLKQINDNLGHEAGDEIIIGVARLLLEAFPTDLCFRIGGDEYMVISKNEDVSDELLLLRKAVSEWKGDKSEKLSISIGVAGRKEYPETKFMKLSAIADQRMYEAKTAYYSQKGFDRRRRT